MSLLIIAATGAYRVAATWAVALVGPLTIPILVTFLIFNIGYVWASANERFATLGAKLGSASVILNLLTLIGPQVSNVLWVALSGTAVVLVLLGAVLLLREATRATT